MKQSEPLNAKKARLAEALRANLQRRKQQARQRNAAAIPEEALSLETCPERAEERVPVSPPGKEALAGKVVLPE